MTVFDGLKGLCVVGGDVEVAPAYDVNPDDATVMEAVEVALSLIESIVATSVYCLLPAEIEADAEAEVAADEADSEEDTEVGGVERERERDSTPTAAESGAAEAAGGDEEPLRDDTRPVAGRWMADHGCSLSGSAR